MKLALSILAGWLAMFAAGILAMGGIFGGGAMIREENAAPYADSFMYTSLWLALFTIVFQIVGQIFYWRKDVDRKILTYFLMFCGPLFFASITSVMIIVLPS